MSLALMWPMTLRQCILINPFATLATTSSTSLKRPKERERNIVLGLQWQPGVSIMKVTALYVMTTYHTYGGRPQKQAYAPGRPKNSSPQSAIRHVKAIAPPAIDQRDLISVHNDIFDCPICQEVVERPVELTECGSVVCAECLCEWLRVPREQWSACPCCYSLHLAQLETIKPASDIILRAIGGMEVSCALCSERGLMKNHKAHLDSNCRNGDFTPAPMDASQLLSRPRDQPLSRLEERLQSSLIKRSMGSSNTLHVKTGGQPITLVHVSSPRVKSDSASTRTLSRRSGELLRVRKTVSGGEEVAQMCNEVMVSSKDDRAKLVEELKRTTGCFQVVISPQESLALKADLQIPWNKLRIMRRMLGSCQNGLREGDEKRSECSGWAKFEGHPHTLNSPSLSKMVGTPSRLGMCQCAMPQTCGKSSRIFSMPMVTLKEECTD